MLPKLVEQTMADWAGVYAETLELLKRATAPAARLRAGCWALPGVRHHILLQPYTGAVHVGLDKEASDLDALRWEERLRQLGFGQLTGAPLAQAPAGYGVAPWVWVKHAADPTASFLAKALNYQPSAANALIGGPSPLAATLTSGLLGAGLGYLGGAGVESILPERHFDRGVLRRNTAMLGALAGAAPGLLWGLAAQQAHPETPGVRAWLSGWPFRAKDLEGRAYSREHSPIKKACDLLRQLLPAAEKTAFVAAQPYGQGVDMLATLPAIPRDEFGRVVLQDPNTPRPIQAATIGLVNTAALAAGNSLVSPWDVARISLGGAARGLVVGKTLGALAGLNADTQRQLQEQGVWGALLTAVVPNALVPPHGIS
jgi:hypothetical protein